VFFFINPYPYLNCSIFINYIKIAISIDSETSYCDSLNIKFPLSFRKFILKIKERIAYTAQRDVTYRLTDISLAAPVTSMLCQKYSCRTVVFVGGLFCALGLTTSYFATRLIHLFFTFGVLTGSPHFDFDFLQFLSFLDTSN